MKYSASIATLAEQIQSLEKLEGYPLAPSFVGAACQPLVDADPTFGLTTKMAELVDNGDGTAVAELDAEIVAKYADEPVKIDSEVLVEGPVRK